MSIIDSHAHLISPPFQDDLEEVLQRAKAQNVTKIVNISTSEEELRKALQLKDPCIYHVASVTPHDVDKEKEFAEEHISSLVAIGETGLDYYYEHSDKKNQQSAFRHYISLAKRHDLPLVIHCREAFPDLYKIFDEEEYKGKAVLHCFTGTLEEAFQGIDRGFYISFSGIITFKKSEDLRAVAKKLPMENILVETDCPYLSPLSNRGKRNEPAFIWETVKLLSDLKGISLQEVADKTTKNTTNLFNL